MQNVAAYFTLSYIIVVHFSVTGNNYYNLCIAYKYTGWVLNKKQCTFNHRKTN